MGYFNIFTLHPSKSFPRQNCILSEQLLNNLKKHNDITPPSNNPSQLYHFLDTIITISIITHHKISGDISQMHRCRHPIQD
mmetsp:Transcript_58287/g.69584  ORF Transcript_58287/g.69584 Transcript_58287/m.69584 type:complete len:81 (-) Transcript_58287:2366-2608(-)